MRAYDPFAEEWIIFAKNPSYSLVEKCLKLSQILEFPDLALDRYVAELNFLGHGLRLSVGEKKNPVYLISKLNEYMFDVLGYEGNEDDYYNPQNNFLNRVIDSKKGIPITLSIIYIQMGAFIGLDLRPVGFPGHFLVKYSEDMILDPFNRGRLVGIEDLEKILSSNYGPGFPFKQEYLNEIEPQKILVRITRNLKNSYIQSFDYTNAIHCINMVLGLEPDGPDEVRDMGIVLSRMSEYEHSVHLLEHYLELAPDAHDVDYVLDLIRSIKERSNQ